MTTRAVERLEEWDSEHFPGGYRALHDLADEEFSGIVTAGNAKLCMLNGTVVGILDGTIDDFEDGEGAAAEAPSPALPLLALMQDRNDEVKAKYYTEDTPISEVDETLTDAGFSGFIELSENVLSGDYYLVYHAGRSMAVAFVGNSKQLLTDEEAFQRADGEVGIYQVRPAEIESVEIPEPESSPADDGDAVAGTAAVDPEEGDATAGDDATATDDTATAGDDATPVEDAVTEPDGPTAGDGADSSDESGTATGAGPDHGEGETGSESHPPPESGREEAGASARDERAESGPDEPVGSGDGESDVSRTGADDVSPGGRANDAGPAESRESADDPSRPTDAGDRRSGRVDRRPETDSRAPRAAGGTGEPMDATEQLETHTIPSLDPSRSASSRDGATAVASTDSRSGRGSVASGVGTGRDTSQSHDSGPGATRRENAPDSGADAASDPGAGSETGETPTGAGEPGPRGVDDATSDGEPRRGRNADARIAELEDELTAVKEELESVESELAQVESERDDIAADREDLRGERDRLEADLEDLERERDELETEVETLESEVETLRSQIEGLETQFGATTDAEQRLTPAEALDQTDIFVRYESRGKATLETAHDGSASREQVNENLGLEYHTQFDAANTSVAGQTFDAFLEDTIQYRFIRWAIEDLLYEIRDTGKVAALQDLYDAIPQIDRTELNGTIDAEFSEEGNERRIQESFDVVMRDRMGNPLFVANLNDSRQAATESMMTSLVTAASHVGESTETLGASFLVTSSFFEPEALETTAEATSGGLLSRDKRESFVKLSRKQGYHLCLVEAREGKFHLAVPEL